MKIRMEEYNALCENLIEEKDLRIEKYNGYRKYGRKRD